MKEPELGQNDLVDFPGQHFGDLLVAAIVFTATVVVLAVAMRLAGTPLPI
jgi:hypothetical protein